MSCDNAIRSDGVFRIKNQKILLTYMTHVDKELLKRFHLELMKNNQYKLKFYEIVHESGHATYDTEDHTHVLIDFGYAIQSSRSDLFDFCYNNKFFHPRIHLIQKHHWNDAIKYINDGLETKQAKSTQNTTQRNEDLRLARLFNWEEQICREIIKVMSIEECLKIKEQYGIKQYGDNSHVSVPTDKIPYLSNSKINWIVNMTFDDRVRRFERIVSEDIPGKILFINMNTIDDPISMIKNKMKNGWMGNTIMLFHNKEVNLERIYEYIIKIMDKSILVSGKNLIIDHLWIFTPDTYQQPTKLILDMNKIITWNIDHENKLQELQIEIHVPSTPQKVPDNLRDQSLISRLNAITSLGTLQGSTFIVED